MSKKSTFNKVRERYMENPFKYLQYKEYSIKDVVKETGLTINANLNMYINA
ncbi:hypothetical protein C621_0220415 [Bacillus thuringiensis serovar aizawai str. Leapi01]|nr:hypothetical protein C621_0220415 [Bacillus thuringiensis serovar aizawai str. Leapi01]